MRPLAVALLCFAATLPSRAQDRLPAAAMIAVAAYSRALTAADCEGMQALSAVMRRHPESKDPICRGAEYFERAGLSERLRFPTANLSSGRYRMVVVPNSRILEADDGPMITNGVYVAVSDDSGHRWQVIDIGCDQLPAWVKGLYPPYDGHPAFKAASVDLPRRGR